MGGSENEVYLNQVDFVHIGENGVNTVGQLFPPSGYWEGVKAITVSVHAHVDGT